MKLTPEKIRTTVQSSRGRIASPGPEGAGRKQREDHDGEDGEVQCRAELGLADSGDELADTALLGQRQDRHGGHTGGEGLVPHSGETAGGEHQEGCGFGGAVAVPRLHRGDHIGGHSQQGGATHQDRGQEQAVLRGEPAGDAAHQTEQEECSHAGKPRARAGGVARPLPLHTDGEPYQPRHGKSQRRIEIGQRQAPRAHWADTSLGPRAGCTAA